MTAALPPGAAGTAPPAAVYGSGGGAGDLIPHPRESLVQYLPPELADEKQQKALAARAAGKTAQIADVLNAILPPKYERDCKICPAAVVCGVQFSL